MKVIYSGQHDNKGRVELTTTALDGLVSVSVEDHSSAIRTPERVWSFLTAGQVAELHSALGAWLSARPAPAT